MRFLLLPSCALFLLSIACDPGGHGVPVPLLELPDRVTLDGIVDDTSYAEVPLVNVGSATAEVSVRVTAPFEIDLATFELEPDATSAPLIAWRPSDFAPARGTITVTSGAERSEVPLVAEVLLDADGDGFDDERAGGLDCDDADPDVFPGAPDRCDDGIDADCDGEDCVD